MSWKSTKKSKLWDFQIIDNGFPKNTKRTYLLVWFPWSLNLAKLGKTKSWRSTWRAVFIEMERDIADLVQPLKKPQIHTWQKNQIPHPKRFPRNLEKSNLKYAQEKCWPEHPWEWVGSSGKILNSKDIQVCWRTFSNMNQKVLHLSAFKQV